MRLKLKEPYEDGEKRVVTKFLLLPRRIGLERRWLEKAKIEQRFCEGAEVDYWLDVRWADR